jgi:two-component system chemotaxis sensor kinase CheA
MSQDPYKYFRVEATELLEQIGKGVLELEKDPLPPDLVPKLLRLAHTLKGAARVVKQAEIAELAHAMEDTLATLRERAGPLSQGPATALLQKLDAIGARVSSLSPSPAASSRITTVATDESLRAVRRDVGEMDAVLEGLAELGTQAGRLRRSLTSVEGVRHVAGLLVAQASAPRRGARSDPSNGLGSKMASFAEDLRASVAGLERDFTAGLDELERELQRVREVCERLRLVPASAVFVPLERVTRDAALAGAKDVCFEGRAGDVRLDADVLARVQPALIQLVRNAVAHGIEPREERVAAGKPPAGSVVLEVARRGGRIVFRCRDDGRGLDLDAVRRSAVRRGLAPHEAQRLGVEDLVQLLLHGGLSTSCSVTEAAGRGVGLDLVREATQGLGGDVVVRTATHAGTTFELGVPASLASLDALLVESSGISAALPLDSVRRVMHLGDSGVVPCPEGPMVVHEGELIRLASLEQLFGIRAPPSSSRARSAIVVDGGSRLAALGVERVKGVQSLLVRPLPASTPVGALVSGASLDGLGNPRPVLDAVELVAAVQRIGAPASPPESEQAPILVIDDSLTTRMLEQSILEAAGYPVDLANSGEEALEKARRRRYGVFLVDVEMPGMNGFEFIERTRQDPELRQVPAVLVTSRAAPEDRKRGASAGASAYIVKSDFDQRQLLETIQRLLRR